MSNFRKAVLNIVNKVPQGKVVSYGQIALMAGIPRAARQVGNTLCRYGEQVPWWRVINNAGRISTTCLDHTALIQKENLMKEGVKVDHKLRINIEKYRWRPDPAILSKLELKDKQIQEIMEKFLF